MGKRKVTNDMIESITNLKALGVSISEIARQKKISRPTVYNVLNHLDKYLTEL